MLVVESLANFMGIPGIQDFAHHAQELIVALKVSKARPIFLAVELTLASHGLYRYQE